MTASHDTGLEQMSGRSFQRLARVIEEYSGIKMPPSKRIMVEGRLRRRVRALGLTSVNDYCDFLFDGGGLHSELVPLIDAVTTNKTEFFREPEHFRYFAEEALPRLLAERGYERPLKVWSAACSTGAEPYTLAMVLSEAALARRGLRFSITATDICTDVLEKALTGIYPEEMIAPVLPELRRRYLLRSKDRTRALVRIAPELRRLVQFGRLNLMDGEYPLGHDFDVIFCRNILIYFEKDTQAAVLGRLCEHLTRGGYLFIGHSETLTGFKLPLQPVAATVFRRI